MNEPEKEIQASDEETRREFLVKAGKFAIYTPPAVMLLMHPSKDALAQSGGGGDVGSTGVKTKQNGYYRTKKPEYERGHK